MLNDYRFAAVIQARMGSTRLPGKVLLPLDYRPALWHILQRLKSVEGLDRIIVATSTHEQDDSIVHFIHWLDDPDVEIFRGPENDVLKRFYDALSTDPPDYVVRITGDSPLFCTDYLQAMMQHIVRENLDGVDGHREKTGLTLGLGSEVYRFEALHMAHRATDDPRHREHVSLFIREQPELFELGWVEPASELRTPYRLTLDYPEDYTLLSILYEQLYREGQILDARTVLRHLARNPTLTLINGGCLQKTV
jgi:spore coat polysaccharide biosynthesis protein SpsF